MGLNDKNLASGVLASSVASSATTLSVNCGTGSSSTLTGVWPSVPFYVTVMPASPSAGVANSLDSEIMQVTAITSDGSTVTMTVSRGKKGTTAKSFGEGSIVTNGIYNRTGRYTASTSSADGASTMVYTVTSDELPNTPSDGDILLVQFPKQADNNATLKVNNGGFDIIYCQSIDGRKLSMTRQENPTSIVEPLLLTDMWYILIYHYDENQASGGWILQNTFLPASNLTPDYSALQTSIDVFSTTYTVQEPCYLRTGVVAYGPSASSGYISLVINGHEAQRAYPFVGGGYYVSQLSLIVPVTTGDQIQVTKTSNMDWGSAKNAYIIPAKGNGWPNYNSEEF